MSMGTGNCGRRACFWCAFVAMMIMVAGCESKARRAAGYYSQAQANRAATAAAMAADWRAQRIKLDDCIDLAFQRVDSAGDVAAMTFAGTVLDFALLIEGELPHGAEMELFWTRLGGLAAAAGEKAYTAGNIPLARSLVLAGPARWQNEAYWRRHPNHDVIAAYVLFLSGEGKEAARRLRSRADLDNFQQQALDEIQAGMRQQQQPPP